jgi:hypothetical protein
MKKAIASAGLVVLGAAGLQAQQYAPAPQLTRTETSKPWSVAASLRGFYDDNYVNQTKGNEEESFGFEVSPSVGLNWTLPQTYIGLSYVYSLRYFDDRDDNRADHSHQANVKLSHVFTERYKLDLSDSFVISREPEVIAGTGTPLRSKGDYLRNNATGSFTAGITDSLSAVLGYSHTLVDFDQEGPRSLSALLDRQEHQPSINLRYQIVPSTVGVIGYQYTDTEYDNNNILTHPPFSAFVVPSDIRNSHSHAFFLGADHTFNPQLNVSLRGGVQYTEYDNNELNNLFPGADDDNWSPYVDANGSWTYMADSYVQLGVRHSRQATDIAFTPGSTAPTLDQEATTVYTSINHKILPNFTASLLAQYQRAEFEGGGVDSDVENFLLAGLNFTYQINQFLAAETGYNFDRLDSDIGRSFTRNRVYVGIRASY